MSSRLKVQSSEGTPMERIFLKVTGRKMTSREKALFGLNRKRKRVQRDVARSAAAHKLTQRN